MHETQASCMIVADYWILACLFHLVFHNNVPYIPETLFIVLAWPLSPKWSPKNTFEHWVGRERQSLGTWRIPFIMDVCAVWSGRWGWVYTFSLTYHNVALIWCVFIFYILNFNVWQCDITAMDMVDYNDIY